MERIEYDFERIFQVWENEYTETVRDVFRLCPGKCMTCEICTGQRVVPGHSLDDDTARDFTCPNCGTVWFVGEDIGTVVERDGCSDCLVEYMAFDPHRRQEAIEYLS